MISARPLLVMALLVLAAARTAAAGATDLSSTRALFGAWRSADGKLVVVGRSDDALFIFDDWSSRRRRATPGSDARELRAAGARLRAVDGDTLTGELDGRAVQARRVALSQEEVRWSDGDVALSGTLWRPRGRARTPAVVLIQGSGPETRWAMRQFPAWLAAHGLTVIAYDKRARWQPWDAGIDVLARDALGAVALLRARADVDPRRVGLLGISNGAFVSVRAAARSPAVGFIIPVVGGGGPLWRHELYRLHNEGVRAGLRAADVRALDSFMKDLYRPQTFAADGKARLTAALAHARGQRWLDVTPLKEFIDAPIDTAFALGRQAWANELSYDPAADLARLRARPALFLLGGADQNIDTALCAAEVHKHAPAARIVVLPKASHYLALSEPRPTAEQVTLSPRLFTSLEAFIARL